MRAIVVELSGADDAHLRGILDGRLLEIGAGDGADAPGAPPERADGELAASPVDAALAAAEGEPL
jgi:hypothetical protein